MNKIEDIIYEINGQLVILSSDLAKLYHSKNGTKEINQAVNRNKNKFTEDDTWILENDEVNNFLVTTSDQKTETRGGKFKNPRVFTTSGIKLLSGIIRTKDKEKITEEILTAFSRKNEILTKEQNTLIPSNDNEYIKNMIYEIRGIQIMFDSDLAKLFKCKNGTKEINQAVKNNLIKFPERYSWVLSDEELRELRSKFLTANYSKMSRTNPRVFTETGVAMLATILKTEVASKVSITIIDAFVTMRHYIGHNLINQQYYNDMTVRHDKEIKILQRAFEKFEEKKKINEIYFNGEIYDAYSKIIDIFKRAKKELIIIDGYSDKTTLDIIRNLKCQVIIITKKNGLLTKLDIEKYNKEYHNLKVYYDNSYHDRYFILDRNIIYHCGTSLNYIGTKTFSINELVDKIVKFSLIKEIDKLQTT